MESVAVNLNNDSSMKKSDEDLLSENSGKLVTENQHTHNSNPNQAFLDAETNRNQETTKSYKDAHTNGKEGVQAQAIGYSPSELVAEDDDGKHLTPESKVNQESKEEANDTKDPSENTSASENEHFSEHTEKNREINEESIGNKQSEERVHAEKDANEQMENNESKSQTDKEKEDEWLDILGSGQLKKKVLKKAQNSYRPQRSQICKINVEGQLENGTIVDKAEKLTIQIGDTEVVQGLDLALPLMDVGELALVQVGPRFAYGSLGNPPDIPSNATITYKVELLSAESEPEIDTLSVSKRKEVGCLKRERGNWWYARQEHTLAIQCYRRALEYLDDVEGGISLNPKSETKEESDELHDLLEDRLKVYNNLAAAQLKIKAYDTALQSVGHVLRCQPNNVKALFRKAKILAAKGENAAAVENLRLASKLEPESRMIKQELIRILSLHKQDTKHERNLYKKMLGQDKPAEPTKNSKFHIPWGILFGTVAAMVAGAVAIRYRFM